MKVEYIESFVEQGETLYLYKYTIGGKPSYVTTFHIVKSNSIPKGYYHRKDKPAFINKTYESWWLYGKRHREDGPAIVSKFGKREWYLSGYKFSKDDFLKKQKENMVYINNQPYLIDGRPIRDY